MAKAQVNMIPLIGENRDLLPLAQEECLNPVHFIVTPRDNTPKLATLEVGLRARLVRHEASDRFQKMFGFAEHRVVIASTLLIPVTKLFPSLVVPSEKVAFCCQSKVGAERKDL
jgi:hypothetical protein